MATKHTKQDNDKAKPRCGICLGFTDRKTFPPCRCVGGKGGSGGSDEKAAKGSTSLAHSPGRKVDLGAKAEYTSYKSTDNTTFGLQPDLTKKIEFNADVISEMLSKQWLIIHNDGEKGVLTISVRDQRLLSDEQRKELNTFLGAILNELDQFKKDKGISSKCYSTEHDKDGNILSLRINLPTHDFYEAFIKRLAKNHMLPIQNIEQKPHEKLEYEKGQNHFGPTPFSNKLTPKASSGRKAEEDERHASQHGKRSSSIRPKTPLDGLKPKDWK